jgi:hypothetical protein
MNQVDFERIVTQAVVNTIGYIQKALAEEISNEIKGCEDQVKINDLLKQHENEQNTLKAALKIITDYTGVELTFN